MTSTFGAPNPITKTLKRIELVRIESISLHVPVTKLMCFFLCSLVCGDVCGKFNVLYGRVRNILKKNKDFEVHL